MFSIYHMPLSHERTLRVKRIRDGYVERGDRAGSRLDVLSWFREEEIEADIPSWFTEEEIQADMPSWFREEEIEADMPS